MVTSLRQSIVDILNFRKGIADKTNPTGVTAEQVGTYDRDTADREMAKYVGTGELPFNQFGDLGFSEPNISAKYEGATTRLHPIAYQVEADGKRNYLRNGTDGQVNGVYLCKVDVDGNGTMTGYSPMSTPWRPAWLPAGDNIVQLYQSAPNQVAVRCRGKLNGTFAVDTDYYAVSRHNGTLDPNAHTDPLWVTFDRDLSGYTYATLVAIGGDVFFLVHSSGVLTGPLEILAFHGRVAGKDGTSTFGIWSGTDSQGRDYGAADHPRMANVIFEEGVNTNYVYRTEEFPGFGIFQTTPTLTVLDVTGAMVTLHHVHEMWASRANGEQDRVMSSRVIELDFDTQRATVQPGSRGSTYIGNSAAGFKWQGAAVFTPVDIGTAGMGNYGHGFSRCPRTGEVLAQTTLGAYGTAAQRYMPEMSLEQWLDPSKRKAVGKNTWLNYVPNLPSPVGSSIGHASPIKGGMAVNSTAGWCALGGAVSEIDYTYPDGTKTKWMLDTSRKAMSGVRGATVMSVTTKDGESYQTGRLLRNNIPAKLTVNPDGTSVGTWQLQDEVLAKIEARAKEVCDPDNAGLAYDFAMYVTTGAIAGLWRYVFVVGHQISAIKQGHPYLAVYKIFSSSVDNGTTLMKVNDITFVVDRIGAAVTGGVINSDLLDDYPTSSFQIAEPDDGSYLWIGGGSPFNHTYVGNGGQPSMSVTMNASGFTVLRDYQAHGYANGDQLFWIPGLGPCAQDVGRDQANSLTTLTAMYYGTTQGNQQTIKGRKLIATQAVYGSWNLYFSEEVYCQINGITGYLPKKTINLRDIQNDPASTTFYLYAKLTGTTMDYLLTPTVQTFDGSTIYIGSVRTDAIHISTVTIAKVFTIDGFSLSHDQVANAIAVCIGDVYGGGVINWPDVTDG